MSFRLKTILGIATIEAVLLGILIFNTLSYLRESNEKLLNDRVSTAIMLFATAAKDAVIASDLATLDSLLASVMENPGMAYARILDADNRIIAQLGPEDVLSRYFRENFSSSTVTDGIYDTQQTIDEAGYSYGTVQIGFNITELQQTLLEARKNSILIASIEMVLVALFSTFLGIYLTRQLTKLSEASNAVAAGDFGYQMEVSGHDEIASTVRAFNHMSVELKEFVDHIQQTKKELLLAKNDAERANEAKTNFLSNMSHELRTPLNAVIGFSEILLIDTQEPEKAEALQEIYSAGKHLLELVTQILDLAKMDAGEYDMHITALDLKDVIEKAAEQTRPLLDLKKVNFQVDFLCEHTHVMADPIRLSQALVNLFSNAIQYNKPYGSVCIEISHADEADCQIIIRDTGIGIPADRLEDIFKPFHRLNQHTYEVQGTGIGLSITRNLIELMHGELNAESELDVGSTFTITLPIALPEDAARPSSQASDNLPPVEVLTSFSSSRHRQPDASDHETEKQVWTDTTRKDPETSESLTPTTPKDNGAEQPMNSQSNGKPVVYVEDNPANMRLIEKLMAKTPKYDLHPAMTGKEGIEVCSRVRPAVILMDINLPDYNGMEVMKILRNEHDMGDTPFIAVTANAMASDLEKFNAAGFDAVLTKPINVLELFETIERLLPQSA